MLFCMDMKLVFHINGGIQAEGICEQGVEIGPKRDKLTGDWRKLHSEELHDLYSSPNIIRLITSIRMMWAGHVARMKDRRGSYRVLVGNTEGKRPIERPGTILKWIFQKWDWRGMDWIDLVQNQDRQLAIVNMVMELHVQKMWRVS